MPAPPDVRQCRICWGAQEETDMGDLIAPCLCSGTIKWVHTACLNNWCLAQRQSSGRQQAIRCEMCRAQYRIPDQYHRDFDPEIFEGRVPSLRTLCRRLVRRGREELYRRSLMEWIVEAPMQAIMLGGFVRGYRVAGPFTRYALHLSLSGCITGAGALLQNSPQLLLLGAVLPHKLRVPLGMAVGTYVAALLAQVPVAVVVSANVGWCFGYAVGCAETATQLRRLAGRAMRPVAACVLRTAFRFLRRGHRRAFVRHW